MGLTTTGVCGGGSSGARHPDWRQLAARQHMAKKLRLIGSIGIRTAVWRFAASDWRALAFASARGAPSDDRSVKDCASPVPPRQVLLEVPWRHPRWPFQLDLLAHQRDLTKWRSFRGSPNGELRGRRNQDPRVCRAQKALACASPHESRASHSDCGRWVAVLCGETGGRAPP